MEQDTTDNCPDINNATSIDQEIHMNHENDGISIASKEVCTQRLDIHSSVICNDNALSSTTMKIEGNSLLNTETSTVPLVRIRQLPVSITNQPIRILSNLPSPTSLNMLSSDHPQSLFLQALAKLNESSLSLAMADKRFDTPFCETSFREITTPDSLTSAPPSYSFVLRQMAVRRRPRIMGTFIPSPSFVQHTPPPNYATAFDLFVDNPIPPPMPPTRAYNFGFTPVPIVCPECGYTGMTVVASKITICTHLCAGILCFLCCWICAPLPYVLRSCKDVYHYCRNCQNFLGMYCPTNPDRVCT